MTPSTSPNRSSLGFTIPPLGYRESSPIPPRRQAQVGLGIGYFSLTTLARTPGPVSRTYTPGGSAAPESSRPSQTQPPASLHFSPMSAPGLSPGIGQLRCPKYTTPSTTTGEQTTGNAPVSYLQSSFPVSVATAYSALSELPK